MCIESETRVEEILFLPLFSHMELWLALWDSEPIAQGSRTEVRLCDRLWAAMSTAEPCTAVHMDQQRPESALTRISQGM